MAVYSFDKVARFEVKGNSSKRILAFGPEMKGNYAWYRDGVIMASKTFGDLKVLDNFLAYKASLLDSFVHVSKPDILLCDAHPQYRSSLLAEELSLEHGIPLVRVQHHMAHAYTVAFEHGLHDFSAVICDGLGYGNDGTIWGGEVFHNALRVGHLEYQYQLGGDAATLNPVRMVLSILRRFLSLEQTKKFLRGKLSDGELRILDKQLSERFLCPVTSSTGRILDAASFFLGFCDRASYDGEPAIVLEKNASVPYELKPVIIDDVLLTTPLFKFLVENYDKDKSRLAATVQQYLVEGLWLIAQKYGKPIVFSGGCAYNRAMTSFLVNRGVLVNQRIPCGDAGISMGQIAYYLSTSSDGKV